MVPATGIAVAGAKLRITEAGILYAMRSAEKIAKDTADTAGPDGEEGAEDEAMGPEGTGCDKPTSEEVLNFMSPPVEAAPILKPVIVTVKTGPAAMAVPPVVMTIFVAAGAPQVPVKEAMLLDPALIVGTTPESKNPTG